MGFNFGNIGFTIGLAALILIGVLVLAGHCSGSSASFTIGVS